MFPADFDYYNGMPRDEDRYRVSRLGDRQAEKPTKVGADAPATTARTPPDAAPAGEGKSPRPEGKGTRDQFRQGGVLERFVKKIQQALEGRGTPQPLQLRIRTDSATKMLSRFELKIIERFVEEKPAAADAPDGTPHFLQKPAAQWKAFFQQFLHRTVKKVAPLSIVQQMIFRGVVQKKGAATQGVLIGDLAFTNGEVDKFARFDIALPKALPHLAQLEPGAPLTPQQVASGIRGEEVQYFAIAPGEYAGEALPIAPQQTAGIFTSLRTEQAIAQHLGFSETPTGADRTASTRGQRGIADDAPAASEDAPSRFVPWWSWPREERTGLRRWFVPVAIGTLVAILGVVVWLIVR